MDNEKEGVSKPLQLCDFYSYHKVLATFNFIALFDIAINSEFLAKFN